LVGEEKEEKATKSEDSKQGERSYFGRKRRRCEIEEGK
jgi:hypothetical protein